MSMVEFVRTETVAPVGGVTVVYELDVPWHPRPRITADKSGVWPSGSFPVAAARAQINRFMACVEAAWSDHLVIKAMAAQQACGALAPSEVPFAASIDAPANNLVRLAHGKTRSEQGGSSV